MNRVEYHYCFCLGSWKININMIMMVFMCYHIFLLFEKSVYSSAYPRLCLKAIHKYWKCLDDRQWVTQYMNSTSIIMHLPALNTDFFDLSCIRNLSIFKSEPALPKWVNVRILVLADWMLFQTLSNLFPEN